METAQKFWNFILHAKPSRVLLFIFSGIFILRLPTLFVEYYDIDILTSFIHAADFFADRATAINKGPAYHWILNGSFWLFGQHPASFHLAGIIVIAMTAVGIFLMGRKLLSRQAGLLAALFYGFCISAFNRQFMAINAEIIYNLFFVFSAYFFVLVCFEKKWWALFPLFLSLVLSVLSKFQGLWIVLALLIYIFMVHPHFVLEKKAKKIYFRFFLSGLVFFLALFLFDWFFSGILVSSSLKNTLEGFYYYVAVRGFDPLFFLIKLTHRLALMGFYHNVLWLAGVVTLWKFFTYREKTKEMGYLITLTLFLLFATFFAGQRLYFHYFVQVYPFLALLAGHTLVHWLKKERNRRLCFRFAAVPLVFLFVWNAKDAYFTRYSPESFYQESKGMHYFRLVMLGQENDYLLPHESYVKALDYIKSNTDEEERIFVWPEGAEFVYYAKRVSATTSFWYNVGALRCLQFQSRGAVKEAQDCEAGQIKAVEKANPDYFIDVSLSPRSDLYPRGGLSANFKDFAAFLEKNYQRAGKFDAVTVWKRLKP